MTIHVRIWPGDGRVARIVRTNGRKRLELVRAAAGSVLSGSSLRLLCRVGTYNGIVDAKALAP